jgi:hypothetical protein
MRVRGDVGDGCVGSGQIFAVSDPAVKLKTWKTEKLTSRPGIQLGRISVFHPHHRHRGRCAGNVLSGKFMLKTGLSGLANINNHLTTGDDPSRSFSYF